MIKNLCIVLLGIVFFSSCEEVPVTIPAAPVIDTERIILIEELTGIQCPSCPSGSADLEGISELYDGNVIVVGIHGQLLTKPIEGKSKYDFRNDASEFLTDFLRPWWAKPSAYFNRVQVDGADAFGNDARGGEWSRLAEDELQKEQTLNIVIDHSYDIETRKLTMEIIVNPLVDMTGDFFMNIMMTESNIIDAQIDAGVVIDEYVHNHVLRDMLTAFDGDAFSQSFTKGEIMRADFSYDVPPEDGLWVAENVNIVAFVTDLSGTSKEVLQAAEEHLIK